MADNADMEVMTVLPKELRLGGPPTMPQARSYLFRQQSTLSSYNPDDQIQINIPRLQRSYLSKNSYLEFQLNGQFKPGTPITFGQKEQMVPDLFLDDAGAWSLFERLEVFDYLGSTVLESIDSVPQLMSLLIDMGADFTDPSHEGPVLHGLGDSYTASNQNDTSLNYGIFPIQTPNTAFPYAPAAAKIRIDGVEYSWTPGATYDDLPTFVAALNGFLDTTGTDVKAQAWDVDFARGILLTKNGASFTVAPANPVPTGNANLMNFLGLVATSTYTSSTTNLPSNSVSTAGVGKSFYCGGAPLVTFGTTRSNASTENMFSLNFCIPIPSFLGFLSKKMVPLHNGFTIVLTLASKYKPMFIAPKQVPVIITVPKPATSAITNVQTDINVQVLNSDEPVNGTVNVNINRPDSIPEPDIFWWNISNVNMVCQILELGPIAESMIMSSSQGQPLIVHTKQMRNYRGNVTQSSAEFYLPLNLNVASLTNILWFQRPDGTENSLRYASVGARCRNLLQRWEFQYGSTVLPQSQGIKCMEMTGPLVPAGTASPFTGSGLAIAQYNGYGECFAELLKARPCVPSKGRFTRENFMAWWYNGLGDSVNFGFTPWRCVNGRSGSSIAGASGQSAGNETTKFACGLNTELVSGKSGELICGLNTNGMNTTIRGYFHPSYLSAKIDVVVDAYAEYDAFVNISPGIATTVSF